MNSERLNRLPCCGETSALATVRRYLKRSRFRACRFLVDTNVPFWERIICVMLVMSGAFCVISLSSIIVIRYNANYLSTTMDNAHHSVADIPFPAVTLCHYNRIDIRKVDGAFEKFMPNASHFKKKMFDLLLLRLNGIRFGSFSKLSQMNSYDYRSMDHLNLSEVYQATAYSCEDLMRKCWWRSRPIKCCELFSKAKSEFGFCHSFNSQAAPMSQYEKDNPDIQWPLQSLKFGIGTGLRVIYDIDLNGYTDPYRDAGVTVMVHANGEWPSEGRFIPTGNAVSVSVEASFHKTSKKLRMFSPEERQCLFDDVSIVDEIDETTLHLPKLPYLRANCLVECRRFYTMKFCNCSVDLLFPTEGYPPCTVLGLRCLSHFDTILNYEKPPTASRYFSETEYGLDCQCLPECLRVEYHDSVKENVNWRNDNMSQVDISVFFKRQDIKRYRTDKAFQLTSFVANIGGVVGFFFGASVLSVGELFFFIMSNLISMINRFKPKQLPQMKSLRSKIAARTVHPTPSTIE